MLKSDRVLVDCSCKICGINARTLGKSLPLRAEINASMAQVVKSFHSVVHLAHDPILGRMSAVQNGVVAL
jgi:hypothetical protein